MCIYLYIHISSNKSSDRPTMVPRVTSSYVILSRKAAQNTSLKKMMAAARTHDRSRLVAACAYGAQVRNRGLILTITIPTLILYYYQ